MTKITIAHQGGVPGGNHSLPDEQMSRRTFTHPILCLAFLLMLLIPLQQILAAPASLVSADITLYTISGNAGLPGVQVNYSDGTLDGFQTTISAADGSYSFTVASDWVGAIRPIEWER